MALASATSITPPSNGSASARIFSLGTISTNTQSNHADITGFISRVYIHVSNGAANSVVWGVDGSHDGTNWFALAFRRETGTFATTDRTTTAGVEEAVFLSGPVCPRYIRVDVTTANANGSTFELFCER